MHTDTQTCLTAPLDEREVRIPQVVIQCLANTGISPFSNDVSGFFVFRPLLTDLFYLLDPNHPSRPPPP